jgi:hypothetical protein
VVQLGGPGPIFQCRRLAQNICIESYITNSNQKLEGNEIMGEKVHFWSDIPNDWSHASLEGDAELDADADNGTAIQIDSIAKLQTVFGDMLSNNETLDLVDFHTHAGPGSIALGSDRLNFNNVGLQLGNQGFEALFNQDAAIIFTGCNVGDNYQGEYFLVCVGTTLLKTNGGKVMGNTGFGVADPLFTGDVFHPTGTWVSANVGAGGGVTLVNNQYLIPDAIRDRMNTVAADIATLSGYYQIQAQVNAAQQALSMAKQQMPDDDWSPLFIHMFNACYYLEQADNNLDSARSIFDPFVPNCPN